MHALPMHDHCARCPSQCAREYRYSGNARHVSLYHKKSESKTQNKNISPHRHGSTNPAEIIPPNTKQHRFPVFRQRPTRWTVIKDIYRNGKHTIHSTKKSKHWDRIAPSKMYKTERRYNSPNHSVMHRNDKRCALSI